jgi:hypothetical protein
MDGRLSMGSRAVAQFQIVDHRLAVFLEEGAQTSVGRH